MSHPNRACACLSLLFGALLLSLSACGGPAGSGGQPVPALLSGVPFPDERVLAALATTFQDGDQAAQRSAGATDVAPSSLQLLAGPGGLEFAIYAFAPNNDPTQAVVSVDAGESSSFWVGLANYSTASWDLEGPGGATQSLPLTGAHLSPLGSVFVAVVVEPNEQVLIEEVQLTANNDPPVADLQASADGPAPLAVNFDAGASTDTEGPIAEYEWEFEAGAGFTSTGTTAVNNHIYLTPGTYTATVRVTDDGGEQATDSVQIEVSVGTNTPPNAVLTGPADQVAPFNANFDASASNDPDGTIEHFRWDLDNDGLFNEPGAEIAAEDIDNVTLAISEPGSYTVSVEVEDDDGGLGGIDQASDTVIANGWKILTLSTAGDEAGRLNSLAVINDKPAVAFQVVTGGVRTLRYSYSSTDTGGNLADWTEVTTSLPFGGGSSLSLAQVDGNPAVSYATSAGKLGYSRSSTPGGTLPGDWVGVTADNVGSGFAFYSSLAVISGNPAIGYQGVSDDTFYVRANTPQGDADAEWDASINVDGLTASGSGAFVCLAQVAGNPALVYSHQEPAFTYQVKYARANNSTGTPASAWTGMGSAKFALDSTNTPNTPWLAVVNGFPAAAYYREGSGDLCYGIADTATGGAIGDWDLLTIDGDASTDGFTPCLAQVGGVPVVTHQSFGGGTEIDLLFNRASTATGRLLADWPANSVLVDADGNTGQNSHVADVNGFIAISYYRNNTGDLRYAILFE